MTYQHCTLCNSTPQATGITFERCGGCKHALYCCKGCQAADWKTHKHICKEYTSFITNNPRPSDTHKLSIFFPVDQKKVYLAWIDCGPNFTTPKLRGILDADEERFQVSHYLADNNPRLRRFDLNRNVQLAFVNEEGAKQNESISKLMKGNASSKWKGPMVVLSDQSGEYLDEKEIVVYQDIGISDLRVIADFFGRYHGDTIDGQTITQNSVLDAIQQKLSSFMLSDASVEAGKVQAVKIHCKGDIHFLGAPVYLQVDIEKDDPVFSLEPIAVSRHLGIPMMVRKVSKSTEWNTPSVYSTFADGTPDNNHRATVMNIELPLDADVGDFGYADLQVWDLMGPGSIILARQDQKPVIEEQSEALFEFIHSVLPDVSKLCSDVSDAIDLKRHEEKGQTEEEFIKACREGFIRKFICKDKFENFFEGLKKKRVEEGELHWAEASSPYDV